VHKRTLHQLHLMAWKRGVKSLYYCRSKSIQRAETISNAQPANATANPTAAAIAASDAALAAGGAHPAMAIDYDECLACQ